MTFRERMKAILIHFRIPLTKNLKYDICTTQIMKRVLKSSSNCIDIGCHKGEIMDEILKFSPEGKHYAFEPLPHFYKALCEKYANINVTIFPVALFDSKGETTFQHVVNAPAYSGIRKRRYEVQDPEIHELTVRKDLLDDLVGENEQIDFIKIDVEGAEYPVIRGGIRTIRRCRPVIIFEFGIGAADCYGINPESMYDLICTECGLSVSTLKGFLERKEGLKREEFVRLYRMKMEYYFVAFG